MKNVHTRLLNQPIEAVRPWIERAWSGTPDDVFPRDYIRTWRQNTPGATSPLVVGETQLGHGPFRFLLTKWDGVDWRVQLTNGTPAWHGFHLEALGKQTRITHTLEGPLGPSFEIFVLPIHNWAVESLFDRLETALDTGAVPRRTERAMHFRARALYAAMSLGMRISRRRVPPSDTA